jgi:hypothetical protein
VNHKSPKMLPYLTMINICLGFTYIYNFWYIIYKDTL